MDEVLILARRYATGAWRRRWIALGLAWLVCLAGWAGVALLPNQYQSTARLYVAADPLLTPLLHGIAIGSNTEAEVQILQRTLLSRPNLETLIAKTPLDRTVTTVAAREALVKRLATQIHVTPETASLFSIAYRNPDPVLARDVVQTMISIYIENATRSNLADTQNARQFLDQQLAYFRQRLQDVEHRLAAFKAKYVGLLPGANGAASDLQGSLAHILALQGDLQDARAKRAMLAKALKTTPPMLDNTSAGGGPSANALRLAAAEQKLQELRLRYTDSFPGVIAQRALVAAIKSGKIGPQGADAKLLQAVPNPVYQKLQLSIIDAGVNIFSLKRRIAIALAQRKKLEAIARSQPGLLAQYANLDRNYGVLSRKYKELLARREAMRISSAASTDANKVQIEVIDPPLLPRTPVAPPRTLLFVAVLLAGIGCGGGLALLLVQIDGSFYSVQDLRRLELPILGGVSLLDGPRPRRRFRSALSFGLALVLLIGVFGGFLTSPLWLHKLHLAALGLGKLT